jgi:hypothetical protein
VRVRLTGRRWTLRHWNGLAVLAICGLFAVQDPMLGALVFAANFAFGMAWREIDRRMTYARDRLREHGVDLEGRDE